MAKQKVNPLWDPSTRVVSPYMSRVIKKSELCETHLPCFCGGVIISYRGEFWCVNGVDVRRTRVWETSYAEFEAEHDDNPSLTDEPLEVERWAIRRARDAKEQTPEAG